MEWQKIFSALLLPCILLSVNWRTKTEEAWERGYILLIFSVNMILLFLFLFLYHTHTHTSIATYHQSYLPSGYTYHPNTSSYPYRATTTTNSGAPEIAEGDLLKIAERVPRDWQHLGIKLGVEYSILENLRTTHPSDTRSAAMEMFGIWQRTKGKHATKKALKTALLELKYGRVANEVFPND